MLLGLGWSEFTSTRAPALRAAAPAVGVSAQIRGTFSFNLNFRGIFLLIKVKDSK